MDEDYGCEFNEGSDIDNWEDEQVFQDHEGQEEDPEQDWQPEHEVREDFGYFGEMGMVED